MTPIALNSFLPVTPVPRWKEGVAPQWKQVAKWVAVAAIAVIAYFVAGWVAFFLVASVGIAYLAITCRTSVPVPVPQNGPRKILQNLPPIHNNALYANLDLFHRWFFDGPNILKNAVRFQFGKMAVEERTPFLERLDRLDEDAVRECYVTALKILVFYPLFIMYHHQADYQGFFKPYRIPGAQPGFRDRTTFHDLLTVNGDLYDYERFPGQAAPPLTSDEKEIFINLSARDILHNTPLAQRAPDRVKRYMRDLITVADRLAEPDHTLNGVLAQTIKD